MPLKAEPGPLGGARLPEGTGRAPSVGTQSRQSITQPSKQPPPPRTPRTPQTPRHASPAGQRCLEPAPPDVGAGRLEGKRGGVTQQTPAAPLASAPRPGHPAAQSRQDLGSASRRGSPAPRAGAGGPRVTSQEPHDFKTPDLTSTDHVGHPLALGPDPSQAPKAHTRMRLSRERKAALPRGQGEVHGPGDTPRSKLAQRGRVGTFPHWPPLCPQGLRKREYRTDLLPFSVLRELTCRLPRTLLGAQKVLPNTH